MAPKREEKATGKLVQEVPKEDKITELQVPRLVQFPGIADRLAPGLSKVDVEFNFRLPARSQPWQTGYSFQLLDEEFNFWLPVYYSSATLRATAASLDLCNPPLAAQVIRRVGGGLLSQRTPLKRPQAIYHCHLQGRLL